MSEPITSLPTANSIDPVQDTFPIVTNSINTTQQINRNTFLGLASAPVGLTDTQNVTNKTFNNTNSLTVKDGSLTLQNTSSTTKQAQFSLASITAGNTRTYTVPDYNGTLATLAGVETLTNKTITSPTINSPTITNATLSADTISGFSTSTTGTIFGMSVTTGTIGPTALASASVTYPKLSTDSSWAWNSWTPTWSNLTLGTSVVIAYYTQVGKLVYFNLSVTLASGFSVGTNPGFSLPVNNNTTSYPTSGSIHNFLGVGYGNPASTNYLLITTIDSVLGANIARIMSGANPATVTATAPATWATTNVLCVSGFYQAA